MLAFTAVFTLTDILAYNSHTLRLLHQRNPSFFSRLRLSAMVSTTSTIDFGARTNLAVTLFDENRFEDCKRELAAILGYQELPCYYRIKCHIILAECGDDWYTAQVRFEQTVVICHALI